MASEKIVPGTRLFSETQRFRVKWIWAIVILSVLVAMFLPLVLAMVNSSGWKEAMLSLFITVPLESFVLYTSFVVKLETIVTTEGVYYRWRPFFRQYNFIQKKAIESAITDDGPVLSYGFHYLPGYGWVYNMGPGKGIRFELIGGKRIFIGTDDINAFSLAVDKMIKGKT